MKIKLTQEQSDNMIAKMLVKDYKRISGYNQRDDDILLSAIDTLLQHYYMSAGEYEDFANSVVF